jgi:hypothetical protein
VDAPIIEGRRGRGAHVRSGGGAGRGEGVEIGECRVCGGDEWEQRRLERWRPLVWVPSAWGPVALGGKYEPPDMRGTGQNALVGRTGVLGHGAWGWS